MTLKVELEPDVEARLSARAQAEGLSLQEFLSRTLGAIARENEGAQGLDSAWARNFHDWVQSHSTATSLLSEDAISRDSIYGERGT
jgi:hypothetical protein